MLKNIIFTLLSLLALGLSASTQAAEVTPAEGKAMSAPIQANPVAEMPSMTGTPAPSKPAAKKTMRKKMHTRDNQTDYRYCLDLKSDAEIAACAYKNR